MTHDPDEADEDDVEAERLAQAEYRAIYREDSEPDICGRLWSPEPYNR